MPTSSPEPSDTPSSKVGSVWRSARRIFRCLRILALLAVLALAGFLFYCSQAGLPDFLKRAILTELRTHGIELAFERLRFRWDRGVVAEKVAFGHAQQVAGPRLTMAEAQIGINAGEALRGRIQVDSLLVRGGRMAWHFAGTNQPPVPLEISHLETDLLIRNSIWELRALRGRFHGADIEVNGRLTNGPALASAWRASQTNTVEDAAAPHPEVALRRFSELLARWQFSGEPSVRLDFSLDATNRQASALSLRLTAGAALTPYGSYTNLALEARLQPMSNQTETARLELTVDLASAQTPWGELRQGHLRASHHSPWALTWQTNLAATLVCQQLHTPSIQGRDLALTLNLSPGQTNLIFDGQAIESAWGKADRARGTLRSLAAIGGTTGSWQLDFQANNLAVSNAGTATQAKAGLQFTLTGVTPELRSLRGIAEFTQLKTPWLAADAANLNIRGQAASNWMAKIRATNQVVWDRLAPLELQWDIRGKLVQAGALRLASCQTEGSWRFPWLRLNRFDTELYGGTLAISGQLNVQDRALKAAVTNQFDVRQIATLLPAQAQTALKKLDWQPPPRLAGTLAATLPPWGRWNSNALAEAWAKANLSADLAIGRARYDAFEVSELATHAAWSNGWWRLRDFHIKSGAHEVWADGAADADGRFELQARSLATPEMVFPFLNTNLQTKLSMARFGPPPWLEISAQGHWNQPETWRCHGLARMTNLVFRGVAMDRLETQFSFATNVLRFDRARVERPEGAADADAVVVDFQRRIVRLENARGRLEPQAVAQAIGPHIVKIIAPYQFHQPPTATVNGEIPMRGESGARVCFEVAGGPFQWWRFQPTNIAATVWWVDQAVAVTNIAADFYGGRLQGFLTADFAPTNGTDMAFDFAVNQVRFAELMRDISDRTNKVEGLLAGRLVVRAKAEDWHSWQGFGNVEMTDGLIWNIPVFGLFSPIFNAISPGLGNSRAREGKATFAITNSVVRSDDLEIHAAGYKMKYRGTVDFDYRLDARVEAEVLRETWMLGPALSLFFKPFTKLFEYRVTGTLGEPKTKPVYIPGFLMKMLSPIKSLRELFQSDGNKEEPRKEPKP